MKRNWILILALLMILALAGCDKNDDQDHSDSVDDDNTTDDDTMDDDTDDDDSTEEPVYWAFDLVFEMRGAARLELTQEGDNLSSYYLALSTKDVIIEGTQIFGSGRYYKFDGDIGMFSVKFTGPAVPEGPCGDESISYSVTLAKRGDNKYVSGGLTAYCGDNTYFGKPARVYRLAGTQQEVEPEAK